MENWLHDVRGWMTAVMLITYLGLFVWTWMGRRDRFAEAANLPFADDDLDESGRETARGREIPR
jgi:cbb3-type cytochrome oxidase subunit 3